MIKNIAHRGAKKIAPENTLFAVEQAINFGADMWELDVQYTADKKLIIIHDDTLERTSDVHLFPQYKKRYPWRVAEFTGKEIKELNFGFSLKNPSNQNSQSQPTDKKSIPSKYRAPFLDEAILFSKDNGIQMNIEIKNIAGLPGHDSIAYHVYALVKDFDFLENALFSSFNHDYLFQIKKIDPKARLAVLMDKPDKNLFSILMQLSAEAYHPYFKIIDQFQIDELHQKGFQVNVWTLNEMDMMKSYIEMGVDGIITDDPALLSSLIDS